MKTLIQWLEDNQVHQFKMLNHEEALRLSDIIIFQMTGTYKFQGRKAYIIKFMSDCVHVILFVLKLDKHNGDEFDKMTIQINNLELW